MSTLRPASVSALLPSPTCADRFGSSRQFALIAGFDLTTTWPRTSACWSSTWPVMLPICLPTVLSMRPVSEPARLPAWVASWPVICSVPVSGVLMVSSFGVPVTLIEPRATVMPMSAFDRSLLTGLSFLPDELARRGGVEALADGDQRHRDRRDHVGGAGDRRQRRQLRQFGDRLLGAADRREEAVERP